MSSQLRSSTRPSAVGTPAQPPRNPLQRTNRKRSFRRRVSELPNHIVLLLLCLVWAVPVGATVITSFRTNRDSAAAGWWEIFFKPRITLDNYIRAFTNVDMGASVLTSLVIAVPATLIILIISSLAAYVFAWMRFPGKNALFFVVVALLVVPPQVVLAPVLEAVSTLGLDGSIYAVWIFHIGLSIPFGVFVLRSAFAALPNELMEAGAIDGASPLTIFFRIVLPTSGPSIAAVGILQFLNAWNDLLGPLIFLGGQGGATPVTTQIAGLVQSNGGDENVQIAAAVIAVIIPIAVFIALQKYFVRGVLGGAVKG